jgi:hypothetical protein
MPGPVTMNPEARSQQEGPGGPVNWVGLRWCSYDRGLSE